MALNSKPFVYLRWDCINVILHSQEGFKISTPEITPVPRITLPEQIIIQFKNMILEDKFVPGQVLPTEDELCKHFKVGRSTVREAKRALALMGLIRAQSGFGTIVTENAKSILTLQNFLSLGNTPLLQVYQARLVLEGELVALAAANATSEEIARVQSAFDKMQIIGESQEDFIQNDLAFHMAVVDCAHNACLQQMYLAVREMLNDTLNTVVRIPGIQLKSYKNHKLLLEAIRNHEPEVAKRITLSYLKEIEQVIRGHLL